MRDPLIHIGYHKTASSWLQKRLFNNPKAGFWSPWVPGDYYAQFILVNPFEFCPQRARRAFAPELEEAGRRGLVPVLTNEALSGNQYESGYPSRDTALRLHAAYPEGRVLLVIREQKSMLRSWYKHHVRAGLAASVDSYLAPAPPRSCFRPLFQLEFLDYHYLVETYQELFGIDRLLVLPFEQFCHDPAAFLQGICAFAGVEPLDPVPEARVVNEGYSALTVALKRRINALIRADRPRTGPGRSALDRLSTKLFFRFQRAVPPAWHRRFDDRLRDRIDQIVGDRYAGTNRRVCDLTGLDLAQYGYALS